MAKRILISVALVFFLNCLAAHGQTYQTLVERSRIYPGPIPNPIEFVGLKPVGGKVIPGPPFIVTNEWLEKPSVNLKNVSDLLLKYIEIELWFPPGEIDDYPHIVASMYGIAPIFEERHPMSDQKRVKPGEVFDIVLRDNQTKKIRDLLPLKKDHFTPIRMILRVSLVTLADGRAWNGGFFYERDPSEPNRWNQTKEQDPSRHWYERHDELPLKP
jgi:hypothetical protein